jgi:hypothetical protein
MAMGHRPSNNLNVIDFLLLYSESYYALFSINSCTAIFTFMRQLVQKLTALLYPIVI